MKNIRLKKMIASIIDYIVDASFYCCLIAFLWRHAEFLEFGQTQPSTTDSIVAIILAITLTSLLHCGKKHKTNTHA
jgi:hypothetical protein